MRAGIIKAVVVTLILGACTASQPVSTSSATTTTAVPLTWTTQEYADLISYCVSVNPSAATLCPTVVDVIKDFYHCDPMQSYAMIATTREGGTDALDDKAAEKGCGTSWPSWG